MDTADDFQHLGAKILASWLQTLLQLQNLPFSRRWHQRTVSFQDLVLGVRYWWPMAHSLPRSCSYLTLMFVKTFYSFIKKTF